MTTLDELPAQGALLGVIVGALEKAVFKDGKNYPTPEQFNRIADTYERYDSQFQHRPDYKLWRSTQRPHFAIRRSWLGGWQTSLSSTWNNWEDLARLGVESKDKAVLWSTIGLAPEIIFGFLKPEEDVPPAIWEFAKELYKRLKCEAVALPSCPASCGASAFFFLTCYISLVTRIHRQIDVPTIQEFLDEIVRWIRLADQSWIPGEKIDTRVLEQERKGAGRLRAGHDAHEFVVLVNSLRAIRRFIGSNVVELNSTTVRLLHEAYEYARSTWLTARSLRLSEIDFQRKHGLLDGDRSRKNRRRAFRAEFQCLLNVANAARDAGNYLEAAKLLYLALRLIPDEFSCDSDVTFKLRRRSTIFRYIKEAGLEIDPRYRLQEEEIDALGSRKRALAESFVSAGPNDAQGPTEEDNLGSPLIEHRKTGFYLRLEHDQGHHSGWQTVLAELPGLRDESSGNRLLHLMRGVADGVDPVSPALLTAAFVLARRYGFIRSAAKILARGVYRADFPVTKKDLLDFVHSARRCMSLDPFGMRHEKVDEWKTLILDCCADLYRNKEQPADLFSPSEKLWIHETLMGRTHTHQKSLNYENASRLFRKASGVFDFDDEDLREFYEREYNFAKKPYGVANSDTISRFCQKYKSTILGPPIFVSLLSWPNMVSLLSVNKDGTIHTREIKIVGLLADVEHMVQQSEFWFKGENLPFSEQINWPNSLKHIADAIIDLAKQGDDQAQVMLLALEPPLSDLPWQHLIASRVAMRERRPLWMTKACPGYLVSVAPNAGSLAIENDGFAPGIRTVLSTERDGVVAHVSGIVKRTTEGMNGSEASVTVVVGHGQQKAHSPIVSIRLGDNRALETIDDWMRIIQSNFVVLHCCHSGKTQPLFMRELGGIPGIGLGLGVRTFIAPVAEVTPQTAGILQTSLFSEPQSTEIGVNYLHALATDSAAFLYNLFGNPYECLLAAHSSARTDKEATHARVAA